MHETSFPIFRKGKPRLTARVEVDCPRGLKPYDEYLFHGLLSLALAEPDQSPVYYATANFILTRLGLNNGGRGYFDLEDAMGRLESATYRCWNFFHPIQREVVKYISFGFVKRCVPLENEAERGWKFVFDEQFFSFANHAYGGLKFPFHLYRRYDPAARRLFLFLRKIFHRRTQTHSIDLDRISDGILGYNPAYRSWEKKRQVLAAASQLLDTGVIALSEGSSSLKDEFRKVAKGKYTMVFHRGKNGTSQTVSQQLRESSLYTMLHSLNLSDRAISDVVQTCPSGMVKQWIQITLAAKDRSLIRTTPAAYFPDNVRNARNGKRTPPDWWSELQKAEDRRQWQEAGKVLRSHLKTQAKARGVAIPTFEEYMRTQETQEAFDKVLGDVFDVFSQDGSLNEHQRRELSEHHAERHMRNRYKQEFGVEEAGDSPVRLSDVMQIRS